MTKLTQKQKLHIRDEWIELRDGRVKKATRLKRLAEKYKVTQKTIKEVTVELNIWTIDGDDRVNAIGQEELADRKSKRQLANEEPRYKPTRESMDDQLQAADKASREAAKKEMRSSCGCIFVFIAVIAYLIYAFSIDYGDDGLREVVDGIECNDLNQCRSKPWYR